MAAWDDPIDDEMFDVDAVEAGAWVPGPYGHDDRLGTYNEVTPAKTARALALLDLTRPVHTFSLGETLFDGFPGFHGRPYTQRLFVSGYQPREPFDGELARPRPRGPNRMSHHEERISGTYNLGSKINSLLHSGVGEMFYNGLRGPDLATTWGVTELDTVSFGPPICTRGLLLDIVACKAETGPEALRHTTDGRPYLHGDYRITVDDLVAAIERQGLPAFEPGDVIVLHTGWNARLREGADVYLAGCPGPFLRELRWLARERPALLGVDAWMLSAYDAATLKGTLSPGHQLLFMRYGIRTGEGLKLAELVDAGVDRFVYCHSPLRAEGATATNAPPMAIANLPMSTQGG